jgi:hypothetical protein
MQGPLTAFKPKSPPPKKRKRKRKKSPSNTTCSDLFVEPRTKIMMMVIMTIGHEYETGTGWGVSTGGRRRKQDSKG